MQSSAVAGARPAAIRLRSLDLFRGATVALMILVNNAGDWGKTWAPLLHADWHGWTPTDLVFPFFLFIVGAAIPFALPAAVDPEASAALHRKLFRRAAILFLLGLALIWFPYYTVAWERARIPGVLQRIAIVYLAAALAWLHLGKRARLALCIALLGGYWAAMKLVPVPGFGAGDLSPQGNLAFHVDNLVLGDHIWRYSPGPGDPEGILSTVPAIVTALIGLFAGEWLLRARAVTAADRAAPRALACPSLTGAFLLLSGFALDPWFPVNKNLWSPTYVLFTGGLAILVLVVLHRLADRKPPSPGRSGPIEALGRNAILAYVGSSALARLLGVIRLGEPPRSLQKVAYERLFASWLPDYWASFAWALAFVALWAAIALALDRRRLYWKI